MKNEPESFKELCELKAVIYAGMVIIAIGISIFIFCLANLK